jgi:20S proteasome subunit beta 3
MKPITFANLVSTALYEKRFGPYFVTPIVAGLENGVPIICSYDSIGAMDLDKFAGLK